MPATCSVTNDGQVASLKIRPPFGWISFVPCTEALDTLGDSVSVLKIDISALDDIDNAGIGILLLLRERAVLRGMRLKLMVSQNLVRDALMLSKIDQLFDVDTSDDLLLEEL